MNATSRSAETFRSIWLLAWRPALFFLMSLFLAGDLADDVAGRAGALHVGLDVLTLSVAFLAAVGTAWQSWGALRRARQLEAAPDAAPDARSRSNPMSSP